MSDAADIAKARIDAQMARLRLEQDVAVLRGRLSPTNAIADLREQASDRAIELRDRAVRTAQRKPVLIAGGAAALALLALIGPLRRAAIGAGRVAWRNRVAIGRFIETKRKSRKDQRP